jgi:hypothetical protein
MATGNHHFIGSLLEAMLGPASHNLANSSDPCRSLTASAIAGAVPSVSTFSATILDAEAECSYAVTSTTAELVECAAAAAPEPAAVIPPSSAVFIEGPKPREPGFRPLFQVWYGWSFFSAVP